MCINGTCSEMIHGRSLDGQQILNNLPGFRITKEELDSNIFCSTLLCQNYAWLTEVPIMPKEMPAYCAFP